MSERLPRGAVTEASVEVALRSGGVLGRDDRVRTPPPRTATVHR
ncbi:hypothetical protein [Streptomyces sp. NPDC059168]